MLIQGDPPPQIHGPPTQKKFGEWKYSLPPI